MGEVWEEAGESAKAQAWLTRGILLYERGGFHEHDLEVLCRTRWRIRRGQGHEPDEYDQIGIDLQRRLLQHLGG